MVGRSSCAVMLKGKRALDTAMLEIGRLVALLLGAHPNAFTAQAADPSVFLMGVWPDRLRLFDQTTDSQTASLQGTRRPAMQP